jgi:Terminase-like family.
VFHNIIDETDCCGRRSGKTVVLSRKAIAAAKRYKREGLGQSLIAICYPTLDRAVRIMWPMLVQKAFAYGWKVDQTHHIIRAPEGSEIWLIGLDDAYDINKLRGNPYHVIMIDECQDLRPNFHQLIDIVIRPALEDYNGKLTLSGTCDPSCHGYWYEACHDQNFAHFNWSMFDNPMLPAWAGKSDWRNHAAAARRRILERNHWDENNPTFRNEYLGLWTRDESKLVYNRYQPEYNDYLPDPKRNLPDGNDWRFIVSLDFGFTDAFATSALAFSYSNKAVYEVNAEDFRGTTLMDWGAVIDRYRRTYDPIVSMVGDEGGLGKAIVVELNKRYGFNIKPAEKSSKNTFIQLVNSLFDKRLLFVRRESPLKDQLLSLTWDRNKDGKEDPKQSNDLTDAFLYGVRESRHYLAIEPDIIPDIGTDEYNKYINDKTKKEFLEYYDKERKGKLRPYL